MNLLRLKRITAFSCVLMASNQSFAIDSMPGVDLWLPKSYQEHFTKLVEAAKKIEREPECWKLLNGRLQESKSTSQSPVFYFRCRDDDRKSFAYEVDINTMDIVNLNLERQRLIAQREAMLEAKAEASGENKKQETANWILCREAIEQKISSFNEAQIIDKQQPKGHRLDKDTMQFKVNVDALSLTNKVLRYSARCNISKPETIDVKIKRRKN